MRVVVAVVVVLLDVTQTEPDNFPRLMELMQDMQEHGQVRVGLCGLVRTSPRPVSLRLILRGKVKKKSIALPVRNRLVSCWHRS